MALIRNFVRKEDRSKNALQTEVECGWFVVQVPEGFVLQLETYGTADRVLKGVVSQTIQIDAHGAARLKDILNEVFAPPV